MQVVDALCSDPKNSVSTFDQISRVSIRPNSLPFGTEGFMRQVSMVHRNFERTEELVTNLLEMNARVGHLEDMLYEDTRDILGPRPTYFPYTTRSISWRASETKR
jgi:exocyst complex component 3